MSRIERREDYESDLEEAEYEKKTALFWGFSTESDDEKIAEIKKEGYGDWLERLKFNAWCWTLAIIGSILLLFAYVNREPDASAWWPIGLAAIAAIAWGVWVIYSGIQKPMDKLKREIRWLDDTLKAVKDRSERIDEDLRARVDPLGDPDEDQSLGEILERHLKEK